MVHKSTSWLAGEITDKANDLLVEIRMANAPKLIINLILPPPKWVDPSPNFYKVNYEASWIGECNGVGIGVVIRDYKGKFYAGLSKLCEQVSSVELTKLMAGFEAIKFALRIASGRLFLKATTMSL